MFRYLFCILLFVSVGWCQTFNLKYKPHGEHLFYVYLYSYFDGSIFYQEQPLITRCGNVRTEDSTFDLSVSKIVFDLEPPDDTKEFVLTFSDRGVIENVGKIVDGLEGYGMHDQLFTYPRFRQENQIRIGTTVKEKYNIKLPYHYDTLGSPVDSALKEIIIHQKYTKVEDAFGLECVKIDYQGLDSSEVNDDFLEYYVKGTLYFAIDEGFVVFDVGESKQEIMVGSKKAKLVNRKKIRLLKYD